MGLEAKCNAVINGEEYLGKLHVDSKEISFSCRGLKWNYAVGPTVAAKVTDGKLVIGGKANSAVFELGENAKAWLDKVRHPPSRIKKLGVKSGQKCFLKGKFESEFLGELEEAGASVLKGVKSADLAFVIVENASELPSVRRLIETLDTGKSIWIIWPKGVASIKDTQVIETCQVFGMGPGKSCAFDDRLTAMRFTKK